MFSCHQMPISIFLALLINSVSSAFSKVSVQELIFPISITLKTTKFDKLVYQQDLTQMRLINQVLVTSLRQNHVIH